MLSSVFFTFELSFKKFEYLEVRTPCIHWLDGRMDEVDSHGAGGLSVMQ